ncbi:MAG TPA: sigma-70 family RNA polymerase sigma factor [Ilumatobacter sp.]|nr:sigma-70 family RNA polymerase sigma factor [Ilumatobacter sp.]
MASSPRREPDAVETDAFGPLVERALAGDRDAWIRLVDRLQRVVWKTVNMMSQEPDVRDDAFAATWLRLAERLGTIREPEKLPGWLATTAANEVRQIRRHRNRLSVGLTSDALDRAGQRESAAVGAADSVGHVDPSERAVALDEHRRVRSAFRSLDADCQEVLSVLVMTAEPVAYDVASAKLQRPVGSLGPTRRRCLDKMRDLIEEAEHE